MRRVCIKGRARRADESWAERRVSKKWPSNVCGRSMCAGALRVSASRCKRMGRATGDDDMSRESGAVVVCMETRKLLRELEEEALDEREKFTCRAL